MENKKSSRREFFGNVLQMSSVALLAPHLFSSAGLAQEKRRGGGAAAKDDDKMSWPLVEPGKEAAGAMHYHHSHEDAKKDAEAQKIERGGVKWDNQSCANCNFYKAVGKKKVKSGAGEKEVEVGSCDIFAKKLVAGPGICNTWTKKS